MCVRVCALGCVRAGVHLVVCVCVCGLSGCACMCVSTSVIVNIFVCLSICWFVVIGMCI